MSRRVPRSAPGRSFLIDDSTISRPPGDVLLASSREPWTDGRRRGARLVRRRAPGTYGPAAPGACPRTTTTNGVAGCYDGSAPGLRPRRAMMPFAARALLMYCEALRRQSTAVLTLPRSSRPSSPRCDSRSPSLCQVTLRGLALARLRARVLLGRARGGAFVHRDVYARMHVSFTKTWTEVLPSLRFVRWFDGLKSRER